MNRWWDDCIGLVAAVGELGPGSLLFEIGGEAFEIPAQGASSHTEYGAEAMTVYADLDGDGRVDHVSSMGYDGTYQVFSKDGSGADAGVGSEEMGGRESVGKQVQNRVPEWAKTWEWGALASPESGGSSWGRGDNNTGWSCVEWG